MTSQVEGKVAGLLAPADEKHRTRKARRLFPVKYIKAPFPSFTLSQRGTTFHGPDTDTLLAQGSSPKHPSLLSLLSRPAFPPLVLNICGVPLKASWGERAGGKQGSKGVSTEAEFASKCQRT